MHEVDPEATEADAEMGQPGERQFLCRPVKPVGPVGNELSEIGEVGPERPPGILGRVRPTSGAQTGAEVLEHRRSGPQGERLRVGRDTRHRTYPTARGPLGARIGR